MIEEAEGGRFFYGCPFFSVLGMEIAFIEPDLAAAFFAGTGKDTGLISNRPSSVGDSGGRSRKGLAVAADLL